ncbi:MAG: dehydratase, partial [Sphingomonadales bacterium]|nr:dehydratase [Sphingomonadales bacterium]
MSETLYTFDTIQDFIGKELGVSDWLPVEQQVMNRFAEDTRDPDWMHIDPVRARRDGPFGSTVAFGFWTLSMLTYFSYQLKLHPEDAAYAVNYGLDRVRWIAPVPVGSR